MGKYERIREQTGFGVPAPRTHTEDIGTLLELTRDDDPKVRAIAAWNLCGCHVRADVPDIWDRMIELMDDPDPGVRAKALHTLGDSSPRHLADRIAAVLEGHRNDPDRAVRRNVNRVLNFYRRTGKVNAL